MIIDELNKKIADIESLANDKSSTIESKVSDLTDGLLMVADAVDIIPEMVDEKITAITKEFSIIKDSVSKVKAQKGDNGRDGIDGIDGVDGLDGKDGSPDKPKDIADKLNTLENVIDPKVIKGSSEYINRTDLNKTISTLENQTRFLIQSNANKSTGSGGGTWGSITGTLSAQTDLQSALDNKLGTVTTDGTLTGAGTEDSPLSVVATSASDVAVTVRAATTAALAGTWTYDNGTSGVGATLTRTTNGVLPNQDGISLSDGDRFLIKNQASTLANGVYVLTQKGVASVSPTIFTRATDADETSELDELVVTISEGSTNRGTVWGQQTNNPVIGTSAITFATVVSTAVTQATSGTQAINQIPLYTGTARQLTRGTANFKYNPTTDLFTIRGIDYTFPANNGDASQVLTTDGSGTLSWAAAGGGGTPAGSDTQIQYNNAGAFGADADFFRNPTSQTFIRIRDAGIQNATLNVQLGSALISATDESDSSFTRFRTTTSVASGVYFDGVSLQNGFTIDSSGMTLGNLAGGNSTKIIIDDVTQLVTISNVPTYADDSAATGAGLTTGQLYKTTTSGVTSLNIVP